MRRNRDGFIRAARIRGAACATFIALTLLGCGGGGGGGDSGTPPTPPATSPPAITSFTPTAGSVGTQVAISGINFATNAGDNTVRFNGVTATVLSASATSLVTVVPSGATTGPLQVITADGTGTSGTSFTVVPPSGPGAAWQTRTIGTHIDAPLSPEAIAHDGTRFVTVGSGAFEASTDARVWTQTSSLTSADDVAWNGQLFVAVRSSFLVHTSPDGLTWTARGLPSGSSADLAAVAASSSIWVAVGESGAVLSSPDGIAWSARTSGATKDLVDVAWVGDRFVAVGTDGTVTTSPDGINWTLQNPPTADSFTAVGGTSSLIVAATFPYPGSQLQLLTSSDGGENWTPAATDLAVFNEIIHAGGRFVAVGYYETATSTDGVAWTSSAQVPGLLRSVVYVNNEYVAVGLDGNSVGAVYTSSDGLNWTIVQSAHALRRVARSPLDGRLVAAGLSHITRSSSDDGATWQFAPISELVSDNYPFLDVVWSPSAAAFIGHVVLAANQYAYASPDGASWTQLGNMPCHGALAASPTQMVNVGFSLVGACIAVSADGASWTSVTPPSSSTLAGVFWTGTQFVATGNSGLIATSPDGTSWTLRSSGVTATLNGGAASASAIVVVGASGTIVTSSDAGVNWTQRSSGTTATLRHAVFADDEFFAVGSGGMLLRSADGTGWARQLTPYTVDFGDIVWLADESRLVLVGESGLVATSP